MQEILVSIAVNGVLGIMLLALLRWRVSADEERLAGPDDAMRHFRAYFPESSGRATVSDDRRCALIVLEHSGAIGLLQRVGRRWNARMLATGDVASARLGPDRAIDLRLADFGWPRARLVIEDAAGREAWCERLESLAERITPRPRPDAGRD